MRAGYRHPGPLATGRGNRTIQPRKRGLYSEGDITGNIRAYICRKQMEIKDLAEQLKAERVAKNGLIKSIIRQDGGSYGNQ